MFGVHEAAGRGRRLGNWGASKIDPDTIVSRDGNVLRNRANASVRDNPWISRSMTVGVANEIGTGIVPRPTTPDDSLNIELRELWKDFVYHCDYSGSLSVYGLQAVAARARREAGEAFILIKRLKPSRATHLPLPLQFQSVPAELCPYDLNRTKLPNGNMITTGFEINSAGKVVAYWFNKANPKSYGQFSKLVRIPANDVIHHFTPTRVGQLRALPETTQALVASHTFNKYNDAELERKAQRATLTGVITKDSWTAEDFKFDPITGDPLHYDSSDVPMLDLEPGSIPSLLPGEKLDLISGDDAGLGFADYQRWQLMGISAGVSLPYQLISGDFSQINDRLWRAIFNEYKREVQQVQNLYIIPQVVRRMWTEFVDRAIVTGLVTLPKSVNLFQAHRVKAIPQSWEYIQPAIDLKSKVDAIEAGLTSRSAVIDEISEHNETPEEVDRQRKIDKDREHELELTEQPVQPTDGTNPEPIEKDKKDKNAK